MSAIRCGNHTTPTYHATVMAVRACYRTNDSVNYHRSLAQTLKRCKCSPFDSFHLTDCPLRMKTEHKAQIQAWLTRYGIFINPAAKTREAIDAECDRVAAKYHAAMLNDHEEAIRLNELHTMTGQIHSFTRG